VHDFAALLGDRAQIEPLPVRKRLTDLLRELAGGRLEERFDGIGLALGDSPVAAVTTLEERPARVRQQHLQAGRRSPKQQDAGADPHPGMVVAGAAYIACR
jgi:hypothetical protein